MCACKTSAKESRYGSCTSRLCCRLVNSPCKHGSMTKDTKRQQCSLNLPPQLRTTTITRTALPLQLVTEPLLTRLIRIKTTEVMVRRRRLAAPQTQAASNRIIQVPTATNRIRTMKVLATRVARKLRLTILIVDQAVPTRPMLTQIRTALAYRLSRLPQTRPATPRSN